VAVLVTVAAGWRVGVGAGCALLALPTITKYQRRDGSHRGFVILAAAVAGAVSGGLMIGGLGVLFGAAVGAVVALPGTTPRRRSA